MADRSRRMQRAGTERLFGRLMEPRRLAGRYTVGNARFMWLVLKEAMRGRPDRA